MGKVAEHGHELRFCAVQMTLIVNMRAEEEDSSSQAATDPDELQMLRHRVDELTAEIEVLRRQLSELQSQPTERKVPW